MGLFKKKGDVPALPELPNLPELPAVPDAPALPEAPDISGPSKPSDVHNLPALPGSVKNDNLNREIIKSAVSDNPSESEGLSPALLSVPKKVSEEKPKVSDAAEHEEASSVEPPKLEPLKMGDAPKVTPISEGNAKAEADAKKSPEPIFVRIDKFQDAKESLDKVQEKAKEMKDILRRIGEVRRKEEEELRGWNEELEKLKSILSNVESDVFGQI